MLEIVTTPQRKKSFRGGLETIFESQSPAGLFVLYTAYCDRQPAQGIAAEMPLAAPAIGNEPGTGSQIKALKRKARPEGLRPNTDGRL